MAYVIFSLIFALFIALFAVQNASEVTINFLWYQIQMSQAVVILTSTLIGVIIMVPFHFFNLVKNKFKKMELNSEIKKLNEENKSLKESKCFQESINIIKATDTKQEIQSPTEVL